MATIRQDYVIIHGDWTDPGDPPPNQSPLVAITNPLEGAALVSGESVTLEATANDPEDGDLTAAINWESDLDGALGVGSPVVLAGGLSVGTHQITASATDSASAVGSDTITVFVSAPPVGDFVYDLEYRTAGGTPGAWQELASGLVESEYFWDVSEISPGPYDIQVRERDLGDATTSDWSEPQRVVVTGQGGIVRIHLVGW